MFEELLVGLIVDIRRFWNNAVNEGCGQDTLSKRWAKKSDAESGVRCGARKSAQLESTTKPVAKTFTGHDVYRLAH
jgi:hypothetical protein